MSATIASRPLGPMTREEEAILLLVQAAWDHWQLQRARLLLGDPAFRWGVFWSIAHEQQVVPLVARRLVAPDLVADLPVPIAAQATQTRFVWVAQALSLHAELQRIVKVLRERGIPVCPLKGTVLAERLYGSIDSRSTSDIDILVPASWLIEARGVLRELGYAPATGVSPGIEEHTFHGVPYIRTAQRRQFVVELHWKLSNPRFVTVDYGALWERVMAGTPLSDAMLCLPTAETLLHLSLHMPKHSGGALRLLADIDRLVRREVLDWPEVCRLAEQWGVTYALYFALVRAQALFQTSVPADALARLAPGRARAAFVQLVASPRMLLRPPVQPILRHTRLQLAHCAMQRTGQRFLDAYAHYVLAPGKLRSVGAVAGLGARLLGGLRGVVWTGLAIATALIDRGDRRVPGSQTPLATAVSLSPGRPAG